jgi:hypothetical protein
MPDKVQEFADEIVRLKEIVRMLESLVKVQSSRLETAHLVITNYEKLADENAKLISALNASIKFYEFREKK